MLWGTNVQRWHREFYDSTFEARIRICWHISQKHCVTPCTWRSICTFNVHYKPSVHTGYNNQQSHLWTGSWITDGKNILLSMLTLTFFFLNDDPWGLCSEGSWGVLRKWGIINKQCLLKENKETALGFASICHFYTREYHLWDSGNKASSRKYWTDT